MRDAAILDGDTIVVREQSTAKNGEIVVATVEGETTVKRLRIDADSLYLVAENPHYAPIQVCGEVTIHGVVVAVMRLLAMRATTGGRQDHRLPRDQRQPERTRHG